ncbi:MAG: PglZ domain-containing protein, partial [Firmicutes bacterium]|nr:PglZ domain-containing protein [Bacillota bacterium]
MMRLWYEPLIDKIEQTYCDLVIVEDGDSLGRDTAIRGALEEHFALHDYQGELPLRLFLDAKNSGQRAVIFKPVGSGHIPFDLERSASRVTWRLKELFPGLDIAVLKGFSFRNYQKIYESYSAVCGSLGGAGAAETLHLICQWLFGVNLASIGNLTATVALLAAFYREEEVLPQALRDHLENRELELPEGTWESRSSFYSWLSGQWKIYLAAMAGAGSSSVIDFGRPHLRELVAGLFMDGHLEPCRRPEYETFQQLLAANPWLQVGLVKEKVLRAEEECRALWERIKKLLTADSVDWPDLAVLWGRCSYLKELDEVVLADYDQVDAEISRMFEIYISNHYEQLFYRSYHDHPVTIDQVMHFLGNCSGERKALLCLDGMGFQEWFCVREYLLDRGVAQVSEGAFFALLPTITTVSRRALFCGRKEIATLLPEEKGFVEHIDTYWRKGRDAHKGVFLNAPLEWNPVYSDYNYLGLVFNVVDDIAHSRHLN